jgi:uncharacterized membrane protein
MSSKATLRMERWIAWLLGYGTWLASLVIVAGLVIAFRSPAGMRVANVGIGLLILLPVSRVVLVLLALLHDRDYRLAIAAALVLGIIFASVAVGLRATSMGG